MARMITRSNVVASPSSVALRLAISMAESSCAVPSATSRSSSAEMMARTPRRESRRAMTVAMAISSSCRPMASSSRPAGPSES